MTIHQICLKQSIYVAGKSRSSIHREHEWVDYITVFDAGINVKLANGKTLDIPADNIAATIHKGADND